jgi:hypothetical protein
MPSDRYRTLQPERPAEATRKVKVWDVALTVVLLVVLTLFALGASYAGFFLVMASDACTAQTCDFALMDVGFWVAVISPWVLLVLAVVFAIVLLVLHRVAFWVPLVSAALMVGMWFVGAAIVGAGIGR